MQVGNTWSYKSTTPRLESQNRIFAPIFIITEAKNAHFFVCKQTGFVHQRLIDFVKITLTPVACHCLWLEWNHSVKNVNRIESPLLCDSSQVRVTKIVTRVEWLTLITLSLSTRVERIDDFWDPHLVQYFHCGIQSDPNPVAPSKYLIQSGLYPKNPSD